MVRFSPCLIGPTRKPITPLRADDRNFYKLEKWTKDGTKIERMLYAGNNLDKARELFAEAIKHRPGIRLTIRQRTRVLQEWPIQ
jgi:hypothetical protein